MMGVGSFSQGSDMRSNLCATTTSKKKSHVERAAKARIVLSGYPLDVPFKHLEDVKEYLNRDKIECLRCGKQYKQLHHHLTMIHGMSSDDYREFYNIPYSYPLKSASLIEAMRTIGKKQVEDGRCPVAKMSIEDRDYVSRLGASTRKRARNSILNEMYYDGINKSKTRCSDDEIIEIFKEMEASDLTLIEVCSRPGARSINTVRQRLKNDRNLREKYDKTVSGLSFKAKARCESLDAEFDNEVLRLIGDGLSQAHIGRMLEVTPGTISYRLRKLRSNDGE